MIDTHQALASLFARKFTYVCFENKLSHFSFRWFSILLDFDHCMICTLYYIMYFYWFVIGVLFMGFSFHKKKTKSKCHHPLSYSLLHIWF